MPSPDLRELLLHLFWADALVWRRVLDLPEAGDDRRLTGLLHHVHSVQLAYVQLLRDEAVDLPEESSFGSLEALMRWGLECHRRLEAVMGAIEEPDLEKEVTFPWAEQLAGRYGRVHPTTVRQALLQLGSHSTYHRGQINTRIRELGGEPPLTDFVAWVWQGCPDPVWPDAPGPDA